MQLGCAHRCVFAGGATAWNDGFRFPSNTHNQGDDLDRFYRAASTGLAAIQDGRRRWRGTAIVRGLKVERRVVLPPILAAIGSPR
jgi:hypothetical protein